MNETDVVNAEIMLQDRTVVDQMQDELMALIKAWADRGISPGDSAQLLAATSHVMLVKLTDCSLGQLIALIVKQWEKHDGRL